MFFSTLVLSASLFFPIPVVVVVITASRVLDPLLVGIIAGLGSSIGELSGYFIGLGGEKLLKKEGKEGRKYNRFQRLFDKYGFWAIALSAVFPVSFIDVTGLMAGAAQYGWKKFLLATITGKIPRYLIVAYVGSGIISLFIGS